MGSNKKLNGGMITGIAVMALGILTPALFWGKLLWRDMTRTYCSGECIDGWIAVVSTFFAVPTLLAGAAIFGISLAVKNKSKAQ